MGTIFRISKNILLYEMLELNYLMKLVETLVGSLSLCTVRLRLKNSSDQIAEHFACVKTFRPRENFCGLYCITNDILENFVCIMATYITCSGSPSEVTSIFLVLANK